jgi:hypothetical protein
MRLSNFTFQVCPCEPVCGGPLPNHHQPKVWRGACTTLVAQRTSQWLPLLSSKYIQYVKVQKGILQENTINVTTVKLLSIFSFSTLLAST